MTKSKRVWMILGAIISVRIAMGIPAGNGKQPCAQLDLITTNLNADEVIKLKNLAEKEYSEESIRAQEAMIEICRLGLYGQRLSEFDAMDYARALTNQTIDIEKRIRALEMLAYHYKGITTKHEVANADIGQEAYRYTSQERDALKMAKEYFERAANAHQACNNSEREAILRNEIRIINEQLRLNLAS